MFELKVILDKYEYIKKLPFTSEDFISKDIVSSKKEENDKYEVLNGEVKFFRAKNENLSLTEKNEFFRFLPINRMNIIFVIAIPINMTIQDFHLFIEKHLKTVNYIRFIVFPTQNNEESFPKLFQAILYFEDQNSADNFYYEYNSKNFQTNRFEYMYLAFINKIDFFSKEDDKIYLNIYEIDKSEITICPLCLEKMDVTSSGIHTILNMVKVVNKDRWINYIINCKVCSTLSKKDIVKCEDDNCLITKNIWCCLVCGYIGCDRYQNCHAVKHFETTLHRYSIDMNTERIWDYLGDNYVHRFLHLNKNEETKSSINFEFNQNEQASGMDSKEFIMRIENIISEYNYVLSTQLEEQRKYYEKEINKIEDCNDNKIKLKLQRIEQLKKEINDGKKNIEENKKYVKDSRKKISNIQKKISTLKEQNDLTDELSLNIKKDSEKLSKIINESLVGNEYDTKIQQKIKLKEEKKQKLEDLYKKITEIK